MQGLNSEIIDLEKKLVALEKTAKRTKDKILLLKTAESQLKDSVFIQYGSFYDEALLTESKLSYTFHKGYQNWSIRVYKNYTISVNDIKKKVKVSYGLKTKHGSINDKIMLLKHVGPNHNDFVLPELDFTFLSKSQIKHLRLRLIGAISQNNNDKYSGIKLDIQDSKIKKLMAFQ